MKLWQEKIITNKLAICSLSILSLFAFMGIYAPFFASGKPLFLIWNDQLFFPFFRYLFFSGYFTKPIDLFFNILMFLLPIACLCSLFFKKKMRYFSWLFFASLQITIFLIVSSGWIKDPLQIKPHFKKTETLHDPLLAPIILPPTWQQEIQNSTIYAQLDLLIKEKMQRLQYLRVEKYAKTFSEEKQEIFPSLFLIHKNHERQKIDQLKKNLEDNFTEFSLAREIYFEQILNYQTFSPALILTKHFLQSSGIENIENHFSLLALQESVTSSRSIRTSLESAKIKVEKYLRDQAKLQYLEDKQFWIEQNLQKIQWFVPPFFRLFHWEENASGSAQANQYLPWYETTRINRKDLTASLFFGLRISFFVGIASVSIAFFIGATLGMIAGFFANKTDLFICRIIEIWEAMPTFFMLLLVVAIAQCKSIFLIIIVLGLFGWTNFARFMRAEVLKQRNLPYALAARSLGYIKTKIMSQEILPNTIAPLLTLLPFAIMAAISSEAALSFLGLGEEGSSSLGVLMDEGRLVFPGESYLLWPPAIVLSILLVAIAILGDALRDALDPRI